jgi:hypothetical protein
MSPSLLISEFGHWGGVITAICTTQTCSVLDGSTLQKETDAALIHIKSPKEMQFRERHRGSCRFREKNGWKTQPRLDSGRVRLSLFGG